jgi:3-oxoadipate enol-lactonase
MEPELNYSTVSGGVRLAYRMSGDPGAPPLVLLHALGEDGTGWDRVAADLASSWRVYVPDLRGHGRSDHPGTYSYELMRDDVIGLMDALGLDRVTLIGHSMGGVVAYLIAQDHPRRVERLVVEDCAPPFRQRRVVPERPDGPLPFDWAALEAVYARFNDPDQARWERAGEITASTLIVAGGPDSHLPQEKLAEIAARIPDCRMVTIEAGHFVHNTRPEDFLTAVRDFLGEHAPS